MPQKPKEEGMNTVYGIDGLAELKGNPGQQDRGQ